MSAESTALRAQLKAFEREFRAKHFRDPAVDDIKKAGYAEKYKLYKALVKADKASTSASLPFPSLSKPPARPTTPPRSQPRPTASIIPKSRAVTTRVSSSSNPFSPVKDRGTKKQSTPPTDRLPNPFASPLKAKPARRSSPRPLSPDPFPPFEEREKTTHSQHEPGPSNPVSRARKRLRGEPVSPSPMKEKRQRVDSFPVLPFPSFTALAAADSDDDDQLPVEQANSFFVADSPVKAAPKGKTFKLLFEEEVPLRSSTRPNANAGLARSRTTAANDELFRSNSQRARSMSKSSDDAASDDHHRLPEMKPVGKGKNNDSAQRSKAKKERRLHVNGFTFGKDNLFAPADLPEEPSTTSKPGLPSHQEFGTRALGKASMKRPLVQAEDEAVSTSELPLLPPSPPPASGSSKYKVKSKAAGRKKLKMVTETQDDEDDSSEDVSVKVRDWSRRRHVEVNDLDPDPMLRLRADGALREVPTLGPASDDDPGGFEVHLPDHLRRMLAISPSKARDPNEEGVVRELLYGQRTIHYDGARGGDIWEVGELGHGTEGEEDWEGEPVPWETGEL